jgi:hypothetical protein
MELTEKQKKAFLKEFGKKVSDAIYKVYGTKADFIRETGYDKKALHKVIIGGDAKLATALKIARALGIKVKDLIPDE